MKISLILAKKSQKIAIKLSCSALFPMKTRVSLKYFETDCSNVCSGKPICTNNVRPSRPICGSKVCQSKPTCDGNTRHRDLINTSNILSSNPFCTEHICFVNSSLSTQQRPFIVLLSLLPFSVYFIYSIFKMNIVINLFLVIILLTKLTEEQFSYWIFHGAAPLYALI